MSAPDTRDQSPRSRTIALVPGSFCSGALLWDAVRDRLHNAGFDVLTIELPTIGPPSTAPAKTMADDAAHIRGIVEALLNDDKEILLVMHSYGGIPGTQAVHNSTVKQRHDQDKKGGVIGLVYIAAILLNRGENSEDSFAAFPNHHTFIKVSGEYLYLDPVAGAAALFPELPRIEGERWARKMPGHAAGSYRERLTSTAHHDVPVTYVKCTSDSIVLPTHQQKMIDDFRAVSRSSVDVVEMATGHCPMVVDAEKTGEIIMNAAAAARV